MHDNDINKSNNMTLITSINIVININMDANIGQEHLKILAWISTNDTNMKKNINHINHEITLIKKALTLILTNSTNMKIT